MAEKALNPETALVWRKGMRTWEVMGACSAFKEARLAEEELAAVEAKVVADPPPAESAAASPPPAAADNSAMMLGAMLAEAHPHHAAATARLSLSPTVSAEALMSTGTGASPTTVPEQQRTSSGNSDSGKQRRDLDTPNRASEEAVDAAAHHTPALEQKAEEGDDRDVLPAERLRVAQQDLAAGWEAKVSGSTGDVYFYNPDTGESMWDKPVAQAAAAAAGVPEISAMWISGMNLDAQPSPVVSTASSF